MTSRLLILIALKFFLILINAKIRPKTDLSIIDGQGFVAYLDKEEESFGTISKCWFKFQDDNMTEIDLNSSESIKTVRGEEIRKFSQTQCGIRVDKVNNDSIGVWTLQAMNHSEVYVNGSIKIRILTTPQMELYTILEKPLGRNTISCTKQDHTRACRLINNSSKESWNQCEMSLRNINNGSSFECRTLTWGGMDESIEKISVQTTVVSSTQYSEAQIEETEDHYVLRCLMKSTPVQECRAEMPDRITQLYIADGLSNGRYSTYDTQLSQSKCALEIPKPLEQSENGLWKIIQHSNSGLLGTGAGVGAGCLFYVGTSSKETIIKEELKRQQEQDEDNSINSSYQDQNHREKDENADDDEKKEVGKGDKDSTILLRGRRIELYSTESTISEITCTVPFVVDDCYLRDPKNIVRFPDSGRFQRTRALGICTFINVQSMPGIWSCGLRGSDYKDDVVQDIEVCVESKLGRVVTGVIRIAQREPLEVMCKSPFEEPISKCVYVSPAGQVHLVASNTGGVRMTGRVQYFGEGIDRGFCGMRIVAVSVDDFGDWSCQFQNVNNGATLSNFTITVKEKPKSQVSWQVVLGIVLGALIVGVILISVIVFGYKKLRPSSAASPSPSINPNPSDQIEAIDMSVRE
ncbi:uncharacterized protein LOC129947695 isoform X2 [Eupeodes corollae]|uniref:uncharacterized protein LOC129947695 isoform X2 n=1 Tax=Eupeodes corollae TaxID=290404 RepID=UPI0024929CA5|nr:uncharacterized protein LOC129947695 isoform X2 [Eupeodes corollae]